MSEVIINRQQVERNYHNNKNTANNSPVTLDCAYTCFQNLMSQLAYGRVLDFGCGDGWVSIMMAKKGYDVYGIDISIELINRARNMALVSNVTHNTMFEEMTGEDLQFQSNFFDSVFGSAVLHHTDLEMALNSIHRVLKPGGTGLFIEPMNQNILLKIWRMFTPWRRSPAERALTSNEICLIKERFPATRLTYFKFSSIISAGLMMLFPKSSFVRKINQKLEKIDEVLIRRIPRLGRYCAVVVIEMVKS